MTSQLILPSKAILRRELRKELARRLMLDFVLWTKDDYKANWHHELLCEYLDAFIKGDIPRLMVFMPPQHGKSELTSRRLPAFMLGLSPKLKIAGCSYSADLARSFNRDVQRIIDNEVYQELFPGTTLSKSNVKNSARGNYLRNADMFEVVGHSGFYKSVGVGGSLTGTPVDIGLIDDPVKDRAEANSPTYRKKVWEWYEDVFLTRLHNGSQQLLTMTRWHKDDLAGKILNAEKDKWEVINLEGVKRKVFHPKDPRKVGEALWGERHSLEKLLGVEKRSERTFNALYQGDPKASGSNLFAYNFKYSEHVGSYPFRFDLPLHYSLDFNVSPYMTGILGQIWKEDTPYKTYRKHFVLRISKIYTLKPPRNQAEQLGRELVNESVRGIIPNVTPTFFLYGDASGNNRTGLGGDTNTLFKDVAKGLGPYKAYCKKRIPSSNPGYKSISKGMVGRRDFLNGCLNGEYPIKIEVDESCSELVTDLEEAEADINGRLLKRKNSDGVEEIGHMMDAFCYLLCHPKSLGHFAKAERY